VEIRASVEEEAATVLSRRGTILSKGRVLKADHFPSCRNKQLPVQLEAAPNLRRVKDRKIYGVGQPTIEGISDVLKHIHNDDNDRCEGAVVWINLREEPFLFINGRSYCVKDWKRPFDNIERTGITSERVRADEEALRLEILAEASRYGGRILLHGETIPEGDSSVAAKGEVYCYWEEVNEHSIVCYHTLCRKLEEKNGKVAFHRIPVTDEHSLQEKDYDDLQATLMTVPNGAAIVLNCQMGRGRTTTGMVIATMLWRLLAHNEVVTDSDPPPTLRKHSGGMQFHAVMDLVQFISSGNVSGRECVATVDTCVEMCAHMQNIREGVAVRREIAAKYAAKGQSVKEAKELGVAHHYLERYIFLVLYQAFLRDHHRLGRGTQRFTEWMSDHPNRAAIYTLIDRMTLKDSSVAPENDSAKVVTDMSQTEDFLLGFQRFRFERVLMSGFPTIQEYESAAS
jgi:hypothetical protein